MRIPICSRDATDRWLVGRGPAIRGNDPTKHSWRPRGDGARTQVRSDCDFVFRSARAKPDGAGFYERLYTICNYTASMRVYLYRTFYGTRICDDNASPAGMCFMYHPYVGGWFFNRGKILMISPRISCEVVTVRFIDSCWVFNARRVHMVLIIVPLRNYPTVTLCFS